MRDAVGLLPPTAARRVAAVLARADRRLPGVIEAAWVGGSIALGDFHASSSDIDLVLVTRRPLSPSERRGYGALLRPRPEIEWLSLEETASLVEQGPLGPVTAATLHRHGLAVRGPRPAELVPDVTHDVLARAVRRNAGSYWRDWIVRARAAPIDRFLALHPRRVEWGVFGLPRQLVTVVEGAIVSKTAGALYLRERVEPRLQRIVDEALRLRRGSAGGALYHDPFARRRDMLALAAHTLERVLEAP